MGDSSRFRIVVDVEIDDEEALIQYACEHYHAMWNGELKATGGETFVERALLEALFFSQECPDGIQFTGVTEITPV